MLKCFADLFYNFYFRGSIKVFGKCPKINNIEFKINSFLTKIK